MNDVSEKTTNPRQDRETERPRWRMKQPTKDELRARIDSLMEQIEYGNAMIRALNLTVERLRKRAYIAFAGGVVTAASACVAGVWLAPLLMG